MLTVDRMGIGKQKEQINQCIIMHKHIIIHLFSYHLSKFHRCYIEIDAKPMNDTTGKDKTMPDRMVQIIIPHKERHSTRISDATQYHKIDRFLRQYFHHIWHANHATPSHTQIHCQRKLWFVNPSIVKCFYHDSTDAADI